MQNVCYWDTLYLYLEGKSCDLNNQWTVGPGAMASRMCSLLSSFRSTPLITTSLRMILSCILAFRSNGDLLFRHSATWSHASVRQGDGWVKTSWNLISRRRRWLSVDSCVSGKAFPLTRFAVGDRGAHSLFRCNGAVRSTCVHPESALSLEKQVSSVVKACFSHAFTF